MKLIFGMVLTVLTIKNFAQTKFPYQNASLGIDKREADCLQLLFFPFTNKKYLQQTFAKHLKCLFKAIKHFKMLHCHTIVIYKIVRMFMCKSWMALCRK